MLAGAAALLITQFPLPAGAALLVYEPFTVGGGPADYQAGDEDAGTNVLGGQNPATGPTAFYNGFKFEFNPDNPDVVSVYLDPIDSIEANYTPAAMISIATSDLGITHHGAITNFTFSGPDHIPGAFDELRWGDTFADVTPFLDPSSVPEPTSLSLLALSLSGLGMVRLRRKGLSRRRTALPPSCEATRL
jgi:hypothetical protein